MLLQVLRSVRQEARSDHRVRRSEGRTADGRRSRKECRYHRPDCYTGISGGILLGITERLSTTRDQHVLFGRRDGVCRELGTSLLQTTRDSISRIFSSSEQKRNCFCGLCSFVSNSFAHPKQHHSPPSCSLCSSVLFSLQVQTPAHPPTHRINQTPNTPNVIGPTPPIHLRPHQHTVSFSPQVLLIPPFSQFRGLDPYTYFYACYITHTKHTHTHTHSNST